MSDTKAKYINGPVKDDTPLWKVFGFSSDRGKQLTQQVAELLEKDVSVFNILYHMQDSLSVNELVAIAFMLGSLDSGRSTYYENKH